MLWGLVGTRHARFAGFVRGPAACCAICGLLRGQPEHHAGHNPAGALAIVALLGSRWPSPRRGWAIYNEVGGEWLEEVHEAAANVMLALVGVHVPGAPGQLAAPREPGARDGHRPQDRRAEEGIRSAWRAWRC